MLHFEVELAMATGAFAETGSLIVPARYLIGVPFTNHSSEPNTIHFSATGRWSWRFGEITTPAGESNSCRIYGVCPMNRKNIGALIVRPRTRYRYVGNSIQLNLRGGETVHFLMNDAAYSYKDNEGFVEINWTKLPSITP